MDAARGQVGAALRDGEARPPVAPDRDAKARQQVEGDVDVGFGDQLAVDLDHGVMVGRHERQGHQQRGEELAGDVAADPDR